MENVLLLSSFNVSHAIYYLSKLVPPCLFWRTANGSGLTWCIIVFDIVVRICICIHRSNSTWIRTTDFLFVGENRSSTSFNLSLFPLIVHHALHTVLHLVMELVLHTGLHRQTLEALCTHKNGQSLERTALVEMYFLGSACKSCESYQTCFVSS